VRWRQEQVQGINNGDAWGDEPDAWAIASPRRSPVDPRPEEWGMYWDPPAAPQLIEDIPNWIQQGKVGIYNRSGLPAEDWEREEEGSPENLKKFCSAFQPKCLCLFFLFFLANVGLCNAFTCLLRIYIL
jgi:hypothetical protein